MYQLSRAYEAQAQPEKALAVLDQLVAKYPQQPVDHRSRSSAAAKSCSAPAAIATPRRAYAAVTRAGPDSGFYEQGLYKHGWSLFKQSRGEESVASFLQAARSRAGQRRQAARARFADASGARAERRRAARHGDHVLRSRRSRDARRGCSSSAAIRSTRTCCTKRLGNLYIEKERYPGRGARLRGVRQAPPGRSLRAVAADAHDRGVPEGRLRLAGARRQAGVRRALRVRLGVLARAHGRGCAGSGRAAEVEPEGPRRVLPRAGAEDQEGRGLHGRGALVSRDARLVPAGSGSARDALPAGRSAVRVRTLRRSGARVRAHCLRLSAAREVCGGRLCSADRVSEARADDRAASRRRCGIGRASRAR